MAPTSTRTRRSAGEAVDEREAGRKPDSEKEATPAAPLLPYAEMVQRARGGIEVLGAAAVTAGAGQVVYSNHAAMYAAMAVPVFGVAAWKLSPRLIDKNLIRVEGERTAEAIEAGEPEALTRRERLRRAVVAASAAATGWVATAGTFGLDPHTLGGKVTITAGALLTMLAGVPYLRFHRLEAIPPTKSKPARRPEPEPEPEPAPLGWSAKVLERMGVWTASVAIVAGALPGTHLVPETVEEIKGGWRAVVASDLPGTVKPSKFVQAAEQVAGAYQVDIPDVSIELMPGNASQAILTVQRENPLAAIQHWEGPEATFDVETGVAFIGVHADGELVRYRFWNSGGAWHDLISGATGSGKSELTNLLLAMERHAYVLVPEEVDGETKMVKKGLIVSRVIDPQFGQSFGDWQDYVDWFAHHLDEARILLQKTEREMFARNRAFGRKKWWDENRKVWRRGQKNWKPTPDNPMISVTIDEAHMILKDPECKRIVAMLGKMGRKVGIKLRLITQVPLLNELGGDMAIRDAVASGNVIVFRTANALSGPVAFNGTLPASPNQLPREWPKGKCKPGEETTAGIGYVVGASARSAVMRAFYPGESIDWIVRDGEPYGEPGVLDELSRKAGVGYEDRHIRLDALDGGGLDDIPIPDLTGGGDDLTCRQAVLKLLVDAPGNALERAELLAKLKVVKPPQGWQTRTLSYALSKLKEAGWTESIEDEEEKKKGIHRLTEKGLQGAQEELAALAEQREAEEAELLEPAGV
ncbi:helix-turn-helix domain-containing protein [Micromonospora maritima]|uniref:helix-turn-helix domain-containing protein n=1 Tax=Micromonospora maritima TaxID=986711 RepID=UPI00157D895E|nr:MarR family transcriptional regulator [Micromonospora maritima]